MGSACRKADLCVWQGALLRLMQSLNYGRIEGLPVGRGEPVLDPPPRIVREIKFGGENGPRLEAGYADFALKAQVRDFFTQLSQMQSATVLTLEVKHGLPFRMTVEDHAA